MLEENKKLSEVGVEVKLGEPEYRNSTNMVIVPVYIKLNGTDEFTRINNYYDISKTGKWGVI